MGKEKIDNLASQDFYRNGSLVLPKDSYYFVQIAVFDRLPLQLRKKILEKFLSKKYRNMTKK